MTVSQDTLTYSSSIDATSLKALAVYPAGASNLPILVVMHSYSTEVSTGFDDAARERYADGHYYHIGAVTGAFVNGEAITGDLGGAATLNVAGPGLVVPQDIVTPFQVGEVITGAGGAFATIASIDDTQTFALFVEMRGRGASGGSQDSGGIEVQDIIDAIDYVLAHYGSETDAGQIHILGHSGGGGNVFSCLARFPDRFNSGISFYGISDYGFDAVDGWYPNAPGYQATMDAWIGGSPSAFLTRYHARASLLAVSNYSGGHLFMFHDTGDGTVGVVNSRNVRDALNNANLTNYTYSESAPGDDPRWNHNLPIAGQTVILGEPDFMVPISDKSYPAWTVPVSGSLGVAGWVDTSRFALWLGSGLDEYGRVAYNAGTGQFVIYGYTGQTSWNLKLKGQTPMGSVTVIINGKRYTQTADGDGVATFTDTQIRNYYLPVILGGKGL